MCFPMHLHMSPTDFHPHIQSLNPTAESGVILSRLIIGVKVRYHSDSSDSPREYVVAIWVIDAGDPSPYPHWRLSIDKSWIETVQDTVWSLWNAKIVKYTEPLKNDENLAPFLWRNLSPPLPPVLRRCQSIICVAPHVLPPSELICNDWNLSSHCEI